MSDELDDFTAQLNLAADSGAKSGTGAPATAAGGPPAGMPANITPEQMA